MASPERFRDTFARLLERQGVSKNELSRRLAALTPRSVESWRRQLSELGNRYVEPKEKTVRLISSALGVDRSTFPPTLTRSELVLQLQDQVAELQQRIAELERELERTRAILEPSA